MNEASSKFVDTLAMEKLINEKLSKVSHSSQDSLFCSSDIPFCQMKAFHLNPSEVKDSQTTAGIEYFIIPSSQPTQNYLENNSIYLYYHPAKEALGNILLIHGLFDNNMSNFAFLIKQLNELKLNVFFMTLPFHYERKPQSSFFSGEFFLSADVYRYQYAFKQAVFDIETSLQFMQSLNGLSSMLVGFSMGGCIAFRHHLLDNQAIKLFIINPVTELSPLLWENPLLLSIGCDLEKSQFDIKTYEQISKELDPCENLFTGYTNQNIAMVYSAYDQMIEMGKYESFIEKSGIKKTYFYSAGHLNVLRVPRLSMDISEFFSLKI